MKYEKMIVLLDDGIKVHGVDDDELVPWLVHALVEVFNEQCGPVNAEHVGKLVIDTLMRERNDVRMNMLWNAIMNSDEDDEDDYDEDDE